MIKDTGERVIPEKMKITNELLIEHIARYHFATHYVYGRVLDFACGTGFGSHIISKKCKHKISKVIGIDIDQNIVKYAKHNYYHPLTTYMNESVIVSYVAEQLGHFDSIISLETVEHVFEENIFLENIYKLLKPEGTLILSAPFGKGRGKPCKSPFHV